MKKHFFLLAFFYLLNITSLLSQLCATPVIAPWSEDFDGTDFISSQTGLGSINNCWHRTPLSDYFWTPGEGWLSHQINTGPHQDHTTGSGQYLFTRSTFSFPPVLRPHNAFVETPLIDLSSLTAPELTFWYHMFGHDIGSLEVEIDNGSGYIKLETFIGQQHYSSRSAWTERLIDLSAYTNDTIRLRFHANKPFFSPAADVAIDDIDIHETPSCAKPYNLTVTAKTGNSVTLNWTPRGAANWQIEYGHTGFIQGSGTIITADTIPFTITGLNSSTTYDFYVRESCDSLNHSNWSNPTYTTTDCLPRVAPWFENFDGVDFLIDLGFIGDTDIVNDCWYRTPLALYFWAPATSYRSFYNTGPTQDHTTGSGQYLFTETSLSLPNPTLPLNAFIETPYIDLSNLSVPELTFWYHMFGADIGSLEVEIDNGSGYTNLTTILGQQQNSGNAPWVESIINLSAYTNDTIRIRLKATKPTFGTASKIAVDDISIDAAPTCPKPLSLTLDGSSFNSITLSWVTGGATNWQIEYGPQGFTLGTGTIVSASTNPYTVSGLLPFTTYDFYVRDSCGISDVSNWSAVVSAITDCLPITAPWSEDFDSVDFVPSLSFAGTGTINNCWDRTPLNTYFWAPGPPAHIPSNTGPIADHTTGSGQYIFSESSFPPNPLQPLGAFVETPFIDLSALTAPELTFWYHMYGQDIDSLEVEIDNGSGYINLITITGQQQSSSNDPWLESIISLTAYANDTIRIRFKATKPIFGNTANIAIDDIAVNETPSCPKPQSLSITGGISNSITLSWKTGGATNWQLEYGIHGFTHGTGTLINVSSNPFTISGLSPSTAYQFYVRDSCGMGDVSEWSAPISDTTNCIALVAPWSEGFDSSVWQQGTGSLNNNDSIDPCWDRNPITGGNKWGTGFGATLSGGTSGPLQDNSGTGKYIYVEASATDGTAELETPPLLIPKTMDDPVLTFFYHMFGSGINSLSISIDTGVGYGAPVLTLTGQQQFSQTDPWKSDTVDLTAYRGTTMRIKFSGTETGFQGDMAIDDIKIDNDCSGPNNLAFSNISFTTANVTWDTTGSNFDIELTFAGSPQGSGTIISGVSSPYSYNNLTPNTAYKVYVRKNCGFSQSHWLADTFTTAICPATTVSFSSTATFLSVSFDGSASINADTLFWDFGDGNSNSGTSPIVNHNYNSAGTYTVTLWGKNICGLNDTISQTITICDIPSAGFGYNNNLLSVSFNGSSTINSDSIYWNFGDGNNDTGFSATHTYLIAGSYKVTLYAYNVCGDIDSTSQTVVVCDSIAADFSINQSGDTVNVIADTNLGATSYYWDLDGFVATGFSVTRVFSGGGIKTISLITVNDCGDSASISKIVNLCELPVADWTYNIIQTSVNTLEVQFDGSASQNATIYNWDFGDGTQISSGALPTHTYTNPNLLYTVCLRVENSCGDFDELCNRLDQIGLNEELIDNSINIYPNPASDKIILSWEKSEIISIVAVYNLQGKKIVEINTSELNKIEKKLELNVKSWPSGIYMFQVETTDNSINYHSIVKN